MQEKVGVTRVRLQKGKHLVKRGGTWYLETCVRGLQERLVHSWHPLAIWLFGSRARGEAVQSRDRDLLIVVPDEVAEVDDSLACWRLKKDFNIPSDLFPCRASEFAEDRNTPKTIAYEAAHGGVLIYER